MMGKKLCVVVCACALLGSLCGWASAQDYEVGKGLNVSLGFFQLTDSDAKDMYGDGFGLTVEKMLPSEGERQLSASIGYIAHSSTYGSLDVKLTNIPVLFNVRVVKESGANNWYYGAGIGFNRMNISVSGFGSDPTTDFCFQLMGGMKFGKNMFADVRSLSGGRKGNSGLMFNVGASF